jgi:hypothetical protein
MWPTVPFVIIIRRPDEVIVSNLLKASGWVRGRKSLVRLGADRFATIFGWPEAEMENMTIEEYCARGLAAFFRSATRFLDKNCRLVDYDSLNATSIQKIADFFKIDLPECRTVSLNQLMSIYSKDPSGMRPFVEDGKRKRRECTPAVDEVTRRWALQAYSQIKACVSW